MFALELGDQILNTIHGAGLYECSKVFNQIAEEHKNWQCFFPAHRDPAQINSWALHCRTRHLIVCLETAQGGTKHYTMELVKFLLRHYFREFWIMDLLFFDVLALLLHGKGASLQLINNKAREAGLPVLFCLNASKSLCAIGKGSSSYNTHGNWSEPCDVLPPLRGLLEKETSGPSNDTQEKHLSDQLAVKIEGYL